MWAAQQFWSGVWRALEREARHLRIGAGSFANTFPDPNLAFDCVASMIITRSPLRIPLGGGGTDLPSYYSRSGAFLIAAAIDIRQALWLTEIRERNLEITSMANIPASCAGLLMFYAYDKARLRHAMRKKGLTEVRFRFDFEGTKILNQ